MSWTACALTNLLIQSDVRYSPPVKLSLTAAYKARPPLNALGFRDHLADSATNRSYHCLHQTSGHPRTERSTVQELPVDRRDLFAKEDAVAGKATGACSGLDPRWSQATG